MYKQVSFKGGEVVMQDNDPSDYPAFSYQDVNPIVFDYKTRLGCLETDSGYGKNLERLCAHFDTKDSVQSETTTYLTALSVGSVAKTLTPSEFVAVDKFLASIDGFKSKVKQVGAFIGLSSANRIIPIVAGTAVTTNVGTATFGDYGAVFNGSTQAINTDLNASAVGTATLGLGVFVHTKTNANGVLIGASNGSTQVACIRHSATNGTIEGVVGGAGTSSAEYASLSIGTASFTRTKTYIHVQRSSGTSVQMYINGAAVGAAGTASVTFAAVAQPFNVGALRSNGSAVDFSNATIGAYVIEDGTLTAGNIATLSTAVNSLMGDLGRY